MKQQNSETNVFHISKKPILLDRIRIDVKLSTQNSKNQQLFLIYTILNQTQQCIQITVRKILQIEYLAADMNDKYGGFVIPVLNINSFKFKESLEQTLIIIGQYLNDLIKNPHCKLDSKINQFLFNQQVFFPNIERYDKVLSDAAILSRRYLNSIFTRKDNNNHHNHQEEFIEFIILYRKIQQFRSAFCSFMKLIQNSINQQEILQDIVDVFTEITCGLGMGVQPIEFIPKGLKQKIAILYKLLTQVKQAYLRWQNLNEEVKQLQCNLYKGMHEDNLYYEEKSKLLKSWSKTLKYQFQIILTKGESLMEQIGALFYKKKKEQTQSYQQFMFEEQIKKKYQHQLELKNNDCIQEIMEDINK